MSANGKRLLTLLVGGLVSIIAGLVWGLALRALGEEVVECVKSGGSAFGAGAVLTAALMLFPFKDGRSGGGSETPPSWPEAQPRRQSMPPRPERSRASTE